MSRIILDVGSANTHKNDWEYLKLMLDNIKAVDTGKHEIIIKHQLFEKAGENIPLDRDLFYTAYYYAKETLGYQTTSSVFDLSSLKCLLNYEVPFIKIANNRKLDWLIGEIPRKIPVYVSVGEQSPEFEDYRNVVDFNKKVNKIELCCVSEYPTTIEDYEKYFGEFSLVDAISDHTTNWDLFNKYNPHILEIHYKLQNSTGLDSGLFARTPEQLKEIL